MMETARPLDIETVQAFVLIADFASFTRAADILETSQAGVSLRLKRLEERLGQRLLDRTPRHVRLTPFGERFLPGARDLLAAHERAVSGTVARQRRLTLGISDHVAGPDLPSLLARLHAHDPSLLIEVRIASSRDVTGRFLRGEIDAAVARRGDDAVDGELLLREPFRWFASPAFPPLRHAPMSIANLAPPCAVRAMAVQALDDAGIAWVETFVGGGVLALGAAVSAGLAVAALAERVAPPGAIDAGDALGLPPLPPQDIVLLSRPGGRDRRDALRVVAAAFRSAAVR